MIHIRIKGDLGFFCGFFVNLCLSLPYCNVCFLQPCGHLLGKGRPLGLLECDVFLCFCHFLILCPGSGGVLDYINSGFLPSTLLLWILINMLFVSSDNLDAGYYSNTKGFALLQR